MLWLGPISCRTCSTLARGKCSLTHSSQPIFLSWQKEVKYDFPRQIFAPSSERPDPRNIFSPLHSGMRESENALYRFSFFLLLRHTLYWEAKGEKRLSERLEITLSSSPSHARTLLLRGIEPDPIAFDIASRCDGSAMRKSRSFASCHVTISRNEKGLNDRMLLPPIKIFAWCTLFFLKHLLTKKSAG